MHTLSITEVAAHAEALARQVQATQSRIAVRVGDKTVAALVSPEDLETLEALEERPDLLDALGALSDHPANSGIPLEDLKAPSETLTR